MHRSPRHDNQVASAHHIFGRIALLVSRLVAGRIDPSVMQCPAQVKCRRAVEDVKEIILVGVYFGIIAFAVLDALRRDLQSKLCGGIDQACRCAGAADHLRPEDRADLAGRKDGGGGVGLVIDGIAQDVAGQAVRIASRRRGRAVLVVNVPDGVDGAIRQIDQRGLADVPFAGLPGLIHRRTRPVRVGQRGDALGGGQMI